MIGFQIRLDKPNKKRKYVWFTSCGVEKGALSKSPVGIYGNMEENTVWITEGILKAQITFDKGIDDWLMREQAKIQNLQNVA